jgi:hypothetical protein
VIGELEQGIQRDDALRFEDAHQVLHHLFMGFGIGSRRTVEATGTESVCVRRPSFIAIFVVA